jgi:hypothetical protein
MLYDKKFPVMGICDTRTYKDHSLFSDMADLFTNFVPQRHVQIPLPETFDMVLGFVPSIYGRKTPVMSFSVTEIFNVEGPQFLWKNREN